MISGAIVGKQMQTLAAPKARAKRGSLIVILGDKIASMRRIFLNRIKIFMYLSVQ
jgi:hypothetical protein